MKKYCFVLFSFLLLSGILALTALAQTPAAQKDLLPAEGSVCTSCNEGHIRPLTTSTPWKLCDTLPCEENIWHQDGLLERQVTHYRYCDHCQALHSYTETETHTAHLHNEYYLQKFQNGTL